MIDTHCHIYSDRFDGDIRAVLDRASEAGITRIFMPAINFGSLSGMAELHHPKISFHKMAGIHPTEINGETAAGEEELLECCSREDIVAVGETGLDYYWSDEHRKEQKNSLHLHCMVAKQTGKPVILHNRESTGDLLKIISRQQDGSLDGIWHCFNGTVEEGKRAIDLGLKLGIGGVLTFKNAGVDGTVAQLPLSEMVLETDAPWLAPAPNRGKRNEPAFMRYTAERLAEVQEKSLEEIIAVTDRNALSLFRFTTP